MERVPAEFAGGLEICTDDNSVVSDQPSEERGAGLADASSTELFADAVATGAVKSGGSLKMDDAPAYRPHPILSWVLIILGVLFLANSLVPGFSSWSGPAGLALGGVFVLVFYAGQRERSGLILPAGGLLTLATVGALRIVTALDGGTVLFAGLALTFAVYGAAPAVTRHRSWAFWPAGACLVAALVVSGVAWAWPFALIGTGAYLLLRRATSPVSSGEPGGRGR